MLSKTNPCSMDNPSASDYDSPPATRRHVPLRTKEEGKAHMKQIKIGTFPLGHENIDLYGLPGEKGGRSYLTPDDKSLARIKIGLQHRWWRDCLDTLLHETFEFLLLRMNHAFDLAGEVANEAGTRVFMFNHPEFSEICARQAMFVMPALPELAKVWSKIMRPTKGKRK